VVRPSTDDAAAVEAVLALSRRAGVPAAELLRSEAEEARRAARADAAAKASVLAVRLMLPLGLCVLPAFMLLGVAPLLLAVITSTISGI
jgi:tight adherence protein B